MPETPETGGSIRERLRAVYSETAVDHILHPRNEGALPHPDGFAAVRSGCGETVKVWLKLAQGRVAQAGFWTDGCAATVACGSMATELAQGRRVAEALSIDAQTLADALGDLPGGNIHCAELAAQALRAAVQDGLAVSREPWKKLYRK
ncbi:MAG: iron-sulfur cluster assembly scaffold protein [Acidobacteriota bacterium]|jgi:nitrogen fixation NifU-like protein|nr:iron-sulfur cluster assembly scaffold protein [Acidobacteriota bacterium]